MKGKGFAMKSKMTTREKTFWAITIPVVLLFFTFNTLPMLKGFMYSFTNYRGYGDYDYVGFRNYKDLFTDLRVGKSYLFTFKYALVGTVLVNVLSLIMALGLNNRIRFKSALRGIYFVPNILGGARDRLYFQLLLHLHRSGGGQRIKYQLDPEQYFGE